MWRRVLRLPVRTGTCIPAGNWHIVQHTCQRQTFIHRRGVEERFDVGTHLTQCLGGAVKLALIEIKATDQRHNGTILRIDRHQRRVHFRHLCQPPCIADLTNPDLLSRLQNIGHFTRRRSLLSIRTVRTRPANAVHTQCDSRPVRQHCRRFLRIGAGDCGRLQRTIGRQRLQRIGNLVVIPRRLAHFPQHICRAAIAVAHVVVQHVITYRLLRGLLHFAGDGGVNAITVFIGTFAITVIHLLAHHFAQVRRRESNLRRVIVSVNRLSACLIELLLGDIPFIQHPRQHDVTPRDGTIHRVERVEGGRRFRQPGYHRHFVQRQLVDRFSEIDLCRSTDTIGAVTKVNLVQIKLEDLVFRQQLFNANREEDFLNLTHQRAFWTEEEVSRQLLGNGTCPL